MARTVEENRDMGDLAKQLFAGQSCSESREVITNPVSALASQLLMGPQVPMVVNPMGGELEDAWEEAEMRAHFQQVYDDSAHEVALQEMEEAWRALRESPPEQASLEQAWQSAVPEGERDRAEEEMELAWSEAGVQVSSEIWRTLLDKPSATEYAFAADNPYVGELSPMSLAASLDERGMIPEAILALEEEVRTNPESSEAWRRLGELHAESDNDAQALAALLSGLQVDPFNLDSLLAIGVSSLNEVRAEDATRYLSQWLERNADYTSITVTPTLAGVVAAFEAACALQPTDAKAATALGVLYVQQRRFEDAERVLGTAVEIDPGNYTLWNKLAAAQYLQGKDAVATYERVLDLRPTYIRAWANLASCYWRQGALHVAARFILCALALNPSDKHLWGKLATMFLLMERLDLVKKIESQDPYLFADEFEVIRRESLPL